MLKYRPNSVDEQELERWIHVFNRLLCVAQIDTAVLKRYGAKWRVREESWQHPSKKQNGKEEN